MKLFRYTYILLLVFCMGCNENNEGASGNNSHQTKDNAHDGHPVGHVDKVEFTLEQFSMMKMKVDTLAMKNISVYVESNGVLEVPPQSQALVGAVIGGNVADIYVIEGDHVDKGQVLATLIHPSIIELQTRYLDTWNKREFLKLEYERQEKLYKANVGAGKEFQRVRSEFQSINGMVLGLEAQLKLLHISAKKVRDGEVNQLVKITAPIAGFIRFIWVNLGQYAPPQMELFDIVNIDHVHADFMVYEKDIAKVKKGQIINFIAEGNKDYEISAEIYSVGKNVEENPKAVHIHAEIENKKGLLLPGMYIQGKINIESHMSQSLPVDAMVQQEGKYFVFMAMDNSHLNPAHWAFTPVEVYPGVIDNQWVEIEFKDTQMANQPYASNNAYFLMSELKKGEAEHSH